MASSEWLEAFAKGKAESQRRIAALKLLLGRRLLLRALGGFDQRGKPRGVIHGDISQHLAIMRQRGIVRTQRVGTEVHYSLADPRILEACHITREVLLQQLTRQASLATPLA